MDLPDLTAVDFTLVRKRGYSPQEVDRFLEVLDAELRSTERQIRVMERRLAGLEEAAASNDETAGAAMSASIAVAEARERLMARARSRAARILEQAYRHAGTVDPDSLPPDLDAQVRREVEELGAEPQESPPPSAQLEAESVESAHRQAKHFLRNAQLEAERIVAAARAEHQGLVARIARLQDLESQLAVEGPAGVVPLRGRGVVVDLTGEEPVVTVTEPADTAAEDRSGEAESDRSTRYAKRSADLPSLGDTQASFTDLAGLRSDLD